MWKHSILYIFIGILDVYCVKFLYPSSAASTTLKDNSKVGVIFDTISVKACWEWWCRWNCDLKVINAWKKAFFVVPKVSPWRPNHVTICPLCHSGESLQNGQLELRRRNWYFAWETHKDTAVSVSACQAEFWKSIGTSCQLRSKPYAVFHGVCKITLTEVLATQMGVMRHSKKVSSFELYKFNPILRHCGLIAREHLKKKKFILKNLGLLL